MASTICILPPSAITDLAFFAINQAVRPTNEHEADFSHNDVPPPGSARLPSRGGDDSLAPHEVMPAQRVLHCAALALPAAFCLAQTEEGEAKRDDENYFYVACWEYQGSDEKEPVLLKEPLVYEAIKVQTRNYKS